MASGRRLKAYRNKTWYRSLRIGKNVTPAKDLPWKSQQKEAEGNNIHWERKSNQEGVRKGGDIEVKIVKNIETVIFIPSTPESKLRKQLQEVQIGFDPSETS